MAEFGTSLPAIVAHARAGAVERAWEMFRTSGFDRVGDDPATLAVKGRLLKDRAQRAPAADQPALLAEAAAAYARAAAIGGTTYPLINAATLSLLAGDAPAAAELARQVLARIDARPDEPETPYYRAATRAEALLLLDRETDARAALTEAVSFAPRAWEDHASTLRQFALILARQGREPGWLDALRPPCSLHFGGHMSFRGESRPESLLRDIDALLDREKIGFGYGALAAGADILIAETLLEHGAELHVLLPGGIAAFAALSVDPFGAAWRWRFEALLGRAETIRAIGPLDTPPERATLDLADQVAMGTALSNARRLASSGVQLILAETAADAVASRAAAIWTRGGNQRRQHILVAPREDVALHPPVATAARVLATLAVPLATPSHSDGNARLRAIKAAVDQGEQPDIPPRFTGDAVVFGYDDPVAAADAAIRVSRALSGAGTVGVDYGVCDLLDDPFSGEARPSGRALAIARSAAASAVAGTVCVSEDLAMALEVADARRFGSEFVGELTDPAGAATIGLYALRRL